jgi:hypothetical protein
VALSWERDSGEEREINGKWIQKEIKTKKETEAEIRLKGR